MLYISIFKQFKIFFDPIVQIEATYWATNDRIWKRQPLEKRAHGIVDFGYICTWVVSYVYTSQEQDAIYASGHGALYVGQRRTRARLNQLAGISRLRDWQGLVRSWTRLGNRNETLESFRMMEGWRDFHETSNFRISDENCDY